MSSKEVLKQSKKEFFLRCLSSLIIRVVLLVIPILFGLAVDNATAGNYNSAYMYAVGLLVIYVIYRFADIWNTYTWHSLYNKMYGIYTKMALDKTFNNSIFSLSRISISEYINIMNTDVDVMCSFYCDLPMRLIRVVEFVIIFVYFFMINLYIGLAGVIVTIIVFIIMYKGSKPIENLNKARAFAMDSKTGVIHELILCIREIKTLNIFSSIKTRVLNKTDDYTDKLLKQRLIEDVYRFSSVLLIEMFRIGLFIYGISLISLGQMQIGTLLIIYNYYGQLIDNVSEFSIINVRIRNLKVSNNRYFKIFEYSRDVKDSLILLNSNPVGEIIFDNVLYGYRDNPVFKDLSFEFKPNTINVITGPSASGKTGILDLLLQLNRQHEGSVRIDGIDISDYGKEEYSSLIAPAFKDPVFFHMSIKSNLSMVDEDFDRIVNICKKLHIHDDIIELKDGYDTKIDNNAANISSNVKYLLGIARVLIRNPKILLFDEAFTTFSKDAKLEIIELLLELKSNHTIVLVARDEEVLKIADKILLMEKGKLIKAGNHQELLKDKIYKNTITK